LRNAGFKLSLAILAGYAVYALWPGLDLAVTRLFFDGNGFPVQQMRGVEAVRMALYIAEDVVPFVALGLAFAARRGVLGLGRRDWVYAFSLFVTGPGLMANVITKPIWGRARPRAIVEFGGTLEYTQPWQFSDQCRAGCSFVSGEMAGATALALVLGMVLLANRAAMGPVARGLAWACIAAIPAFTAWQRIAAGRHFLSDVVFGALFTLALASLLRLAFRRPPLPSGVDSER
jgi:lipid A 4'-phosphatase